MTFFNVHTEMEQSLKGKTMSLLSAKLCFPEKNNMWCRKRTFSDSCAVDWMIDGWGWIKYVLKTGLEIKQEYNKLNFWKRNWTHLIRSNYTQIFTEYHISYFSVQQMNIILTFLLRAEVAVTQTYLKFSLHPSII